MGLTRPRAYQILDQAVKSECRAVATSTVTLSGGAPATVDGVALAVSDRVLVNGQSTSSQNGIYVVNSVGTGSNGTWSRANDANQTAQITSGMLVMVSEGTTYANTEWYLSTKAPITLGTTGLTFAQFSGGGGSSYGNANVATYLTSYSGNLSAGNVLSNVFNSTGSGNITLNSASGIINASDNVGGFNIPIGNTLQRPSSVANGMIRYNSDNGGFIEGYLGTGWVSIISSGTFLASNLLLYYDFGNSSCYSGSGSTVGDLSGNGNAGALQNSPTYSASNGGIFNFSASNQYITTNFKVPAAPRSHGYWVKFNAISSIPNGYVLMGTQESGAYTYIGITNGGEIYWYLGQNTGGQTSGFAVTAGVWYHLFETISASGAMNIYKNGVAVLTTTGSVGSAATSNFGVGALGGGGYPLGSIGGSLGKVTVYNIELSSSQVLSNFNADKSRYGY